MDEKELKELARQLRQPNGLNGIEIADIMNDTNINMTFHSIEQLNLLDGDCILELGHGNCKHLPYILEQKGKRTYYGLDISELMNKEAKRINQPFVDRQQAHFHLYDGINIPFNDNHFDKIFTVNTIYFWEDPKLLLSELYRVMKPKGIMSITFADKDFMKQLPFTQFGFTLYDQNEMKKLIKTTKFEVVSLHAKTEVIKSKTNDIVNRGIITFTVKK